MPGFYGRRCENGIYDHLKVTTMVYFAFLCGKNPMCIRTEIKFQIKLRSHRVMKTNILV